jgi:hypothetical protein
VVSDIIPSAMATEEQVKKAKEEQEAVSLKNWDTLGVQRKFVVSYGVKYARNFHACKILSFSLLSVWLATAGMLMTAGIWLRMVSIARKSVGRIGNEKHDTEKQNKKSEK